MEFEIESIANTAIMTSLALWAQHYTPWERITGKPLSRLGAYTLGTLAIVLPLVRLFVIWNYWRPYPGTPFQWAIAALLAVVVAAGLTVFGLYLIDGYKILERRASIAEELNERAE